MAHLDDLKQPVNTELMAKHLRTALLYVNEAAGIASRSTSLNEDHDALADVYTTLRQLAEKHEAASSPVVGLPIR